MDMMRVRELRKALGCLDPDMHVCVVVRRGGAVLQGWELEAREEVCTCSNEGCIGSFVTLFAADGRVVDVEIVR